jgi:hypothetical protein
LYKFVKKAMPLPAAIPIAGQALGLLGGLAGSLGNIFGGRREEREAERLLEEFEYPELKNVYEGMSIATLGGDILREDAAQASADIIDAAREGGSRLLYGALPRAVDTTLGASRTAAADVDRQFSERERLRAGDEQRIQGINERRAEAEIAGIGARLNYGRQRKTAGMRDLVNTGFATASMFGGMEGAAKSDFNFSSPNFGALQAGLDDIEVGMPRNYGF